MRKRGQEKCLPVYIVQAVFFHRAKNVLGDFYQKKKWLGRTGFFGVGLSMKSGFFRANKQVVFA